MAVSLTCSVRCTNDEAEKRVTPVIRQFGNSTNATRRSVTGYDVDVVGREL